MSIIKKYNFHKFWSWNLNLEEKLEHPLHLFEIYYVITHLQIFSVIYIFYFYIFYKNIMNLRYSRCIGRSKLNPQYFTLKYILNDKLNWNVFFCCKFNSRIFLGDVFNSQYPPFGYLYKCIIYKHTNTHFPVCFSRSTRLGTVNLCLTSLTSHQHIANA